MNLWYQASNNSYINLDQVRWVSVIHVGEVVLYLQDTMLGLKGDDAEELCGYLQTQVPRAQQIEHFGEED